jgi:hypothetical protein
MSHTTEEGQTFHELRGELSKSFDLLRRLRDEIRLEIHLAGMEAKDRWEKNVEPRFREIEQMARKAGEASRKTMDGLARDMKEFRDSMKRHA